MNDVALVLVLLVVALSYYAHCLTARPIDIERVADTDRDDADWEAW